MLIASAAEIVLSESAKSLAYGTENFGQRIAREEME